MKRLIVILAILVAGSFITPAQAAASCGNSFPADGHNGPWYANGAVHGNTVHISCPSSSTFWQINYVIQWSGDGGNTWNHWWNDTSSGTGTPNDFSYGIPAACDAGLHLWRTHIHNYVTGGDINKPAGGGGVYLGC